MTTGFVEVTSPDPHRERARRLLAAHPEARDLIGYEPRTALFVLVLVALQSMLAILLAPAPWWLLFVVAYTVGAVANFGLWVLIHECSHDLVFSRKRENILLMIFADFPIVLPSAMTFRRYHLLHHRRHGDPAWDGEIPGVREARLIGNGALRKFGVALPPVPAGTTTPLARRLRKGSAQP